MAESPTDARETEQARRKRSIENKYIQPPTQKARLMNFRLATMHNCIFICSCCHRQEFKSSVQEMENTYITIPLTSCLCLLKFKLIIVYLIILILIVKF